MNRPRVLRRPAALAVAVLLTACGQVHPGAAAVIDGTRIPLDEVDSLSAAYCRANIAIAEAQGQPTTPEGGVESRRRVLGAILQLEIARRAADSLGVEVEPSSYAVDEGAFAELLTAVGEEHEDEVTELVRMNAESNALLVAIGAHELGQDVAQLDEQQRAEAGQAGQDFIREFGRDLDIDIDPRLGVSPEGAISAETGSLSVAVSDEATTPQSPEEATSRLDALPELQVCR